MMNALSTHWERHRLLFKRLEELLHVFKFLRLQDQTHGRHGRYRRRLVVLGESGIGGGESFDEIIFVYSLRDPIERGSHGASLASDHVTVHTGGDGVFPEDGFAALGIAGDDGLGIGVELGNKFAEFYIIKGA